MSKRNFILLIIVLAIATAVGLLFLYLNRPTGDVVDNGGDNNFLSNFNPFGSSKNVPPPAPTEGEDKKTPGTDEPVDTSNLQLVKVSTIPIAGYGVFMKERYVFVPEVIPGQVIAPTTDTATPVPTTAKPATPTAPLTEFVPALRYVERSTGNIFQTFADKIDERKFSSTIIPKVYEAHFLNKGQSVVMRYLKADDKTIVTFVGALPKDQLGGDTTETNEVKGVFLPENITDLSVDPGISRMFYLFNSGDGAIGINTNYLTDKKVQIFDSPFTEWLSQWTNPNLISLNTKPSARVPGYVYALDPNKKTFTKILGEINGLTTLVSPSGKLVLYGDSSLSMSVYNTETRETTPLSLNSFPEKCTWTKNNDYVFCSVPKTIVGGEFPDSWYKGEVSFSDAIWKIDIINGNTEIIIDPSVAPGGEEIDGTKLALDEKEENLFFVNKKDSYLWQLKLTSN